VTPVVVGAIAAGGLLLLALVARVFYGIGFRAGGDNLADEWANAAIHDAAEHEPAAYWPAAPARETRPS
jgi:hypothetical protein